ncbi:ornithine decarboxylase-like [Pecten maximus]|uniref:ornithine decarboxylase-like n=1 Tax=Pecten maximus TaxID=6579 RepID=UPI0014591ADF|nr:ornithine decarboxylase-like [Pecten maximus]
MMTFDSEEELVKIKRLYPSARLLLRFRPKHSCEVLYDLGKKFGCDIAEAMDLFQSAKIMDLNVIGVSFYVGANCSSRDAFSLSIQQARKIFDIGLQVGFALNILDIGGGFRGRYIEVPSIAESADIINKCLDDCFPEEEGVKIIAEPGRYLVESAISTAARIIGRKIVYNNGKNGNCRGKLWCD